jgi:hypothetical protein
VLVAVDVLFCMRDRRAFIEPGKTDFERGERAAIDHDRPMVRAANSGVPQSPSGLEGLDLITVINMCHDRPPLITIRKTDHESRGDFVNQFTSRDLFFATARHKLALKHGTEAPRQTALPTCASGSRDETLQQKR